MILTSIQFSGCKHTHPKPRTSPLALGETGTNPDGQRATTKDGQKLQAYNGEISASPSSISFGVFTPESTERIGTIQGTVDSVRSREEMDSFGQQYRGRRQG